MFQISFRNLTLFAMASLVFLASGTAQATNFSFTGLAATCPFTDCSTFVPGNPENWGDFRNWSPQGVPGAADTATIGSFTVNLFGTRSVQRLTLNAGTLKNGTLNLTGPSSSFTSSWTGGTLNCTLNVAAGALFRISGSASRTLDGGTINNSGTVTWLDDGAIFCGNAPVFSNKSGGVFNAQNNSSWFFNFGASPPVFTNQAGGVVNKSGANTTSTFGNVIFNNSGTVNGLSGLLELNGGGTSPGTFTAADGGRVNISGVLTGTLNPATGGVIGIQQTSGGNTFLNTGLKCIGAGVSKIYSGTVTFNGTVTTGQTGGPGTLEIENGRAIGTAASNLVSAGTGFHNWTGGTIGADGSVLNIGAGAQFHISGSSSRTLDNGTINNSGTVTWLDDGAIFCGNAPVFSNKSGGVFNAQNNSSWFFNFGASPPVFTNQAGGVVNKSGANTTSTFGNVIFNNSGTVNGLSGLLELNGGGTSPGTFTAANAARVNISGTLTGTLNPATGGVIGIQQTSGGNTLLNTGLKCIGAGVSKIYSGTVTFNGTVTTGQTGGPGTLEIENGRAIGTAASNLVSAGTGFHNWTGGTIGADGSVLNIGAGAQFHISGSSSRTLDNGTINNSGTVTWLDDGAIFCGNAPVFSNKSGGVFNAQNNGSWFYNFGPTPPVFTNQAGGVVNKSGAGTTSTFGGVIFGNAGMANVNDGTLAVNDGFTQTAGATTLNGGTLSSNTALNLKGGTLMGNGDVNAAIINSGGTVSPGLSPGTINDNGNYKQTANGALQMEINGSAPATQDHLDVNGTVTLNGTLHVELGFTPALGATFTIINNDSTDAITGIFAELPQNGLLAANGVLLQIAYDGGDGNDVTLTRVAYPTLSINDVTITEGTSTTVTPGDKNATFTVTLSFASPQTVSVNAIPANGTAKAPADYTTGGDTLIFEPGETKKTFIVPVIGDDIDEDSETFFVLLSSPVNASILRGRGVGTINDNDLPPSITIEDVNIGEGNGGQRAAIFRLHLSSPSGKLVKVNYATGVGTATAGDDYDAVTATQIAFTTGQTVTLARVLINGDTLNEPNETFKVNLSGAVNATIDDPQALGTILNDDSTPALTINDVSISEGDGGTRNVAFTVSLSVPSSQTITVNFATADGVARSTSDYVTKTGTLTFAAGQTSKTVNVTINGDTAVEDDETFFILLSDATNANISKARGIGTITNDDSSV